MNNVLSRKNVTENNFIMVRENDRVYQVKKPEFCPLKQYSENEYVRLLKLNPIFLANDAKNYADQVYARNLCRIYVAVSSIAVVSDLEIKRFYIANLEKALFKFKREYPKDYADLCRDYSINPEKKISTSPVLNLHIHNNSIIRFTHWGYSELFVPHTMDYVERIAEKTYSTANLSAVEKAKWAHLFFIFIAGFDHMQYETNLIETSIEEKEQSNGGKKVTPQELKEIVSQAIDALMKIEPNNIMSAISLNYIYDIFFCELDNESINLDMVQHFVYTIVSEEYHLQMFNLVGLLSDKENDEFKKGKVQTLKTNADVRTLKEKVFPYGAWASGINCFLVKPDSKVLKAMIAADVKYVTEDFNFGQNVETYKSKHTVTLYSLGKKIQLPGYLYASTPIRLRISDPNEIRMIHFYFATHCY